MIDNFTDQVAVGFHCKSIDNIVKCMQQAMRLFIHSRHDRCTQGIIISVNKNILKKVLDLPPFSTLSVFELVGPVHVQNNGLDHSSAIIEYAP